MNAAAPSRAVPWQAKYVALAFIWGASFLFMKIGLRSMAPLQISTLRILLGTAVVVALLYARGGRLPADRRLWAHLFVSGFLLCSLPFTLFALGETRVASALAGIGNATTPIASVIFTWLLLRERVPNRKVLGVIVGFVGVVVIMQPWSLHDAPDPLGFGMTLVAGCCYGLGWTYVKRFVSRSDPGGLTVPAGLLVAAAAQMAVVIVVWWMLQDGRAMSAPWSIEPGHGVWPLMCVAALGVIGTGAAQAMQYDVVRAAGPTVATSVTYLIPIVSVALGILVLDERMTAPELIGAVIVLSAAVLIGTNRASLSRAVRQRRSRI